MDQVVSLKKQQNINKILKMEKKLLGKIAGKVRKFCQSGNVGTMKTETTFKSSWSWSGDFVQLVCEESQHILLDNLDHIYFTLDIVSQKTLICYF